jgi:uncharacterized protein YprB with RNaseH-like and TPR domain
LEVQTRQPLNQLKASQLRWLANHYCPHGHTFLSHYQCYEPPKEERVGFLDIETSNLAADFGIILSYCIKDGSSKQVLEGVLTPEDVAIAAAGNEDKRVVKACIEDILKFDRLVTYYGKRFDMPFIRTRAVSNKVPFPLFKQRFHTDLYDVIKRKFRLSSNRLENACRVLLGKTDKTRIENRFWRGAVRGDERSLSYVLDHNRKDVLDLEKLYRKTIGFSQLTEASI